MGVFSKPFIFVGKEFTNEQQAREYFQSKIKLTQDDLDDMGSHLHHWMNEQPKSKGYPKCGLYSIFTGDENRGYYIGYDVYDKNPEKMIKKISDASDSWKKMFKEKPQLVHAILYT
jgi:hypothetical protein